MSLKSFEQHQLWAFFALTLLIGWYPWYTGSGGVFLPGPTVAAFIVTGLFQGREGMGRIVKRMLHWRVGWRWYGFILLAPAVIYGAAVLVHVALGGAAPQFEILRTDPIMVLMVFLAFGLPWQSSAFMEEIGFRGYALAEHQSKWGPLVGTLILGFFFGAWFLPEFTRPVTPQAAMGGMSFYPWFILTEIGWSLIMTWVYNRTNGSALVSGYLFHVTFNAWALMLLTDAIPGEGFPAFDTTLWLITAVVVALGGLLLAVGSGGRLGYEPEGTEFEGGAPEDPPL
jgi:membrane protease YdiL (CAAX protease family)